MYALISPNENNRICQVEENIFPVADPLHWVDLSNVVGNVTTEWIYVDGNFVPPVPVVVEVAPAPTKEELLAQLQALQTQISALA